MKKGGTTKKKKKQIKSDIKWLELPVFTVFLHCFLCCWKKDRDPSISRKRAEAVRGVDACPGGRRVLKELSMRG